MYDIIFRILKSIVIQAKILITVPTTQSKSKSKSLLNRYNEHKITMNSLKILEQTNWLGSQVHKSNCISNHCQSKRSLLFYTESIFLHNIQWNETSTCDQQRPAEQETESTRTLAVESTCISHAGSAIKPMQWVKKTSDFDADFWPFYLRVNARWGPAMDYRSTEFVALVVFLLEHRQTDRQTNKQMELSALFFTGGYSSGVE